MKTAEQLEGTALHAEQVALRVFARDGYTRASIEYGLPLLDEPLPAAWGDYRNPHTTRWAATISSFNGYLR